MADTASCPTSPLKSRGEKNREWSSPTPWGRIPLRATKAFDGRIPLRYGEPHAEREGDYQIVPRLKNRHVTSGGPDAIEEVPGCPGETSLSGHRGTRQEFPGSMFFLREP